MHLLINALSIIHTATLAKFCCNHSWLLSETMAENIALQNQNIIPDFSLTYCEQ